MKKISRHKIINKDIPDDIFRNILLVLPMKALVRVRSVCKSWLKLIMDPSFAYKRLEEEETEGIVVDLVILLEFYATFDSQRNVLSYGFHIVGDEDYVDGTWNPKIMYQTNDEGSIKREDMPIVGACNGLICTTLGKEFHIINPLYPKDIYTVPFPPDSVGGTKHDDLYSGFGYDESTKCFKIVFLFMCRYNSSIESSCHHSHSPLIFEFGSSSSSYCWRQLTSEASDPCIQLYDRLSVLVGGHLYWISEVNEGFVFEILSFDLSKEVFEVTHIPMEVIERFQLEDVNRAMLFDLDGRLALVELVVREYIKIWLLVDDDNNNDNKSPKKKKWIEKFHIDCKRIGTTDINNVAFWKPCNILLKMGNEDYIAFNTKTKSSSFLTQLGLNCILCHRVSLIYPPSLAQ